MFMQPCVFLSDRSHIKKFTPNNYLYIKNVRRLNIRHLTFLFISIKHAADAGPQHAVQNHLNSTLNPATE